MWIDNVSELFSIDMYPLKHDSVSTLCNKLTRMLIVVVLLMLYFNYSFTKIGILLGIGLIGIVSIYLITIKKEKFSQLPSKMDGYTLLSELSPEQNHSVNESNTSSVHAYPRTESYQTSSLQQSIAMPAPVSPVTQSTSTVSPVTQSTFSVSPVTQSTFSVSASPVTQSTSTVSPVTQSTSTVSPVTQSTSTVSSVTQSTSTPVTERFQSSVFSPEGKLKVVPASSRQVLLSTSTRSLFEMEQPEKTDLTQLETRSKTILRMPDQGYKPYHTSQPRKKQEYYTPEVGTNTNMYQKQVIVAPRIMDSHFSAVHTDSLVDENPLQDFGGMAMPTRIPRRTRMLLPREKTEESIVDMSVPANQTFRRNVQPHVYSMSNERIPINASVGISSTPQLPPVSKQRFVGEDGRTYPVFSRIDPQLVRDDVPEQRKAELPRRNGWSEYLPEPAQDNPMYSIYDPRFTGYGDESRSYYDTTMGQIKYYYGDVDAYRSPNFIIRNKVDHVDMIDPMGVTHTTYPRTASLEDVNDQVNDDWLARSTEFREDIMEKLMRKNNSESWQLRQAPMSRGARLSTFTSSY